MYFERKELIQSLDLVCFVLFVYVWLLDGRTLWLVFKAGLQIQVCNPVRIHPTWVLPSFVILVAGWNGLVALMHLFGPAMVVQGKDRSVLLDFVGQQHSPSRLHMLFIDAVLCIAQLALVIVAFEVGKDELKPDDEASPLDVTPQDEGDDQGQGWDVRDEEATLFTPTDPLLEPSSLSQPIAVIRVAQIWSQILDLRTPSSDDNHETAASPSPLPEAVRDPSRPDTSRIRRFSRQHRQQQNASSSLPAQAAGGNTAPTASASVDDSWPPMWLVIARNMVGTNQSLSFLRRPGHAFTLLRRSVTSRLPSAATTTSPQYPESPDT